MSRIVGIIYPNALPAAHKGGATPDLEDKPKLSILRHKNLEISISDSILWSNERKKTWVFLDGEIHNAKALREELQLSLGYRFRTETDEELIVHAYDAWKEECLKRFWGPFALAIFDEENEILLLGRDRLGQKPLYWSSQGNYWLFSTQLKALLSTGIVPQTPSMEALGAYLCFGFVPQDLAMIHHVNKLLPGYYLKVNLSKQVLIEQFWSYSQELEACCSYAQQEIDHRLSHLFKEAFQLFLPQEKVGAALLNHEGSVAMAWHLHAQLPTNALSLFSAYFDAPSPSMSQKYQSISDTLASPLTCKRITAEELLQELPLLVWHLEEPLADPYLPQTWCLAKTAASQCNVLYSATGWEEIFGISMQPYSERHTLAFLLAHSPAPLRNLCLFPLLNLLGLKCKYRLLRESTPPLSQACHSPLVFSDRERGKIAPQLRDAFDPKIFSQRFHKLASIGGSIAPALYYESKTKLPDSQLFQYERLFSAHGIKVVNPYLHPPLVSFLAQLSDEIKFGGKMPAPLLRAFTEKTFPNFAVSKEKEFFLETWCNQPIFREAYSRLAKGHLAQAGILSPKWIKGQLGYPYLIPSNFNQLWALLLLEVWFDLFIDQPILEG